jgi:hypothetical protein
MMAAGNLDLLVAYADDRASFGPARAPVPVASAMCGSLRELTYPDEDYP